MHQFHCILWPRRKWFSHYADSKKVREHSAGSVEIRVLRAVSVCLPLSSCLATSSALPAIPPGDSLASLSVSRWGRPSGIPGETFAAVLALGDDALQQLPDLRGRASAPGFTELPAFLWCPPLV